jgi:hypothetical protein
MRNSSNKSSGPVLDRIAEASGATLAETRGPVVDRSRGDEWDQRRGEQQPTAAPYDDAHNEANAPGVRSTGARALTKRESGVRTATIRLPCPARCAIARSRCESSPKLRGWSRGPAGLRISRHDVAPRHRGRVRVHGDLNNVAIHAQRWAAVLTDISPPSAFCIEIKVTASLRSRRCRTTSCRPDGQPARGSDGPHIAKTMLTRSPRAWSTQLWRLRKNRRPGR